jgi:cyanophycinase
MGVSCHHVRDEPPGLSGRRPVDGSAARWVYIPTAAEDPNNSVPPNKLAASGATMTRLHTYDRKEADSETFVAPLRTATAVYFVGGR